MLVDRLDRPDELNKYSKRVVSDMQDEWNNVDKGTPDDFTDDTFIDTEIIVDAPENPHDVLFVQWDRATRAWGVDVPDMYGWHNQLYDSWERNPRYVFSARDQIRSLDLFKIPSPSNSDLHINHASIFSWKWELPIPEDPDDMDGQEVPDGADDDDLPESDPDPWFTVETWSPRGDSVSRTDGRIAGGLRLRKPTYFDMNYQEDELFPDKGWYGQSRVRVSVDIAAPDDLRTLVPDPIGITPHAYTEPNDDGEYEWTFAASPAFYDYELHLGLNPDDPRYGIGENEAIGEDLDGDYGDGEMYLGEVELDMALPFPMQMLQKNGDFEQVGEVLNCWIFGHMIEGMGVDSDSNSVPFNPIANVDEFLHISGGPLGGGTIDNTGTVVTFSEFLFPRILTDEDGNVLQNTDPIKLNYEWDWWAPITACRRYVTFIDDISTGKDDTYRTEYYVDARVNRLRFDQTPVDSYGLDIEGNPIIPDRDKIPLPMMVGGKLLDNNVVEYPWSRLSVAGRVLDLFVCDGPARLGGSHVDNLHGLTGPTQTDLQWFSFYNANGFTGKSTPGMININTATVEVMRALPHMNKIVHATHNLNVDGDDPTDFLITADVNPRSLVPEAIVQWREKYNGYIDQIDGTGFVGGPDFNDLNVNLRIPDNSKIEETRGFASVGEIGLLMSGSSIDSNSDIQVVTEPWDLPTHQAERAYDAWRIDFAGLDPFSFNGLDEDSNYIGSGYGAKISTDVNKRYYDEHNLKGDRVSGDSEELNMLQAGISNLITTTSDVFTVHMRIRTFRKNSITNVWDATDLDYIIDDSRYVMLVDRSEVNAPQDKPKILYFEKLPN